MSQTRSRLRTPIDDPDGEDAPRSASCRKPSHASRPRAPIAPYDPYRPASGDLPRISRRNVAADGFDRPRVRAARAAVPSFPTTIRSMPRLGSSSSTKSRRERLR